MEFVKEYYNRILINCNATQRELFKYIVLELRTFALKKRLNTFWYQCSQYWNEMVRREEFI